MESITTDKAFENQLASIKMEGYKFSADEIENVKKCLNGEISFIQFKDTILKEIRNA